MKKTSILALMFISVLLFSNSTKAQEVGIGDIIFTTATTNVDTNFFIGELSYTIITLHLYIANKSNIDATSYEGETLTTIKKLEELTKTDVIELLNLSKDKQGTLNTYLASSFKEIQKWDTISTYIKWEMALLKSDMQSCLIDKNISDKAYFDAVERYDQAIMQTSLTESIQYENCITDNRIKHNAKARIENKLVFYLWLLQRKYEVMFAKQEILANNFDIFRDNILPDLNEIDRLLQQYKF